MKTTLSIAVVLAIFFAVMYFHKPCGHDQASKARDKQWEESIRVLRSEYDSIIKHNDYQAYEAFKKAQESSNRWEKIAVEKDQQLKNEIKKRRTFSDHSADSLLSLVR